MVLCNNTYFIILQHQHSRKSNSILTLSGEKNKMQLLSLDAKLLFPLRHWVFRMK